MPWCDDCSKFWNPNTMPADGSCPTCGSQIAGPARAPWHFKVLLLSVAVYLGWRAVQGVEWVIDHL